jgi:hypothetical protein
MMDTPSMNNRTQPKRILLSWSGGKDSAWALHLLRQQPQYEVVGLLTTLNERFHRVAIHGFREQLLDLQAASIGLPLWKVDLPFPCSNADYESRMAAVCARAVAEGIHSIAFGDLFLEDIRAYRIEKLTPTGLEPIFPVWTPTSPASTRATSTHPSLAAPSTLRSSPTSQPRSIHAASAESSTPSPSPAPSSRVPSPSSPAKP